MTQSITNVSLSVDGRQKLTGTNFADLAEENIQRLVPKKNGKGFELTTTKLRGIYGLITNVLTRINEEADFEEHRSDLQYLKVKMAYEAGREDAVKDFLNRTGLRDYVSAIKGYDQFVLYCRYAESLVAYFKFYGGKD